jgi:hypothetical protein
MDVHHFAELKLPHQFTEWFREIEPFLFDAKDDMTKF